MANELRSDLDRAAKLLREIPERRSPLPHDVSKLIDHAYDDVQEARGRKRMYDRPPQYVSHFEVGDDIGLIVQSYTGPQGQITPDGMSSPDVRPGKILQPPRHRSPNDYENMGDKTWFFTSDLPVSIASRVDCTMHVELSSDRREIFHIGGEHWSTWHEKNGTYWSVLTVFKDATPLVVSAEDSR